MKFLPSLYSYFAQNRGTRRNLLLLSRFLLVFLGLVFAYSSAFHYLMELEGRNFSWVTGFYWTLTVMSTLGFGDITFQSDIGRVFSMVVLLSGVLYLLVLLPFTLIEFFYAPWTRAQQLARAPRKLPPDISGHVLLTHLDPVTEALIPRLERYGYRYALIVEELEEALRLHDQGYQVVVGRLDDPETYRACRVESAALVASTAGDPANTNVAFTVCEQTSDVPIVTTANREASVDILELAGSSRVFRLADMMGQTLARRIIGCDAMAHEIGRFDELVVAEASVLGTPLVGKSLVDSKLREMVGTTVVGIWERGEFHTPQPEAVLTAQSVLILAGTAAQIQNYNAMFCIYHHSAAGIIIIGGGRVGRAVARALAERGIEATIVEANAARVRAGYDFVEGDAADLAVLKKAGVETAPAVVITPHDDDINIYLTIYCRKLRPDLQIISRATHERNVSTLHRAGADFVMSYASMGANAILNLLKEGDVLMLTEGLNVFRVEVPEALAGKSLLDSGIRAATGCSVIGLVGPDGQMIANPAPKTILEPGSQLVLIGSGKAESKFLELYPHKTGNRHKIVSTPAAG